MSKKNRINIPNVNKVRALLQKEINSSCPFCQNDEVAHFQIHHIDQNPSNNDFDNLILLCPICHSKIHSNEIEKEEVKSIKLSSKNKNTSLQFISVTIDSDNCGWEISEKNPFAFHAKKLKSLFPIFNFSFINHSDKTILLTNIKLLNKHLPIGLAGPDIPLPTILRPAIRYKIKLPSDNQTINVNLSEEIEIPQGRAFKFQVEIYADNMDAFKPFHKYALDFKFGFNNDFLVEIPKILLNSDEYYEKLSFCNFS
ncbi:MAG: HNH endonuclease signature motif containing protein [Flavobacterium sp.]